MIHAMGADLTNVSICGLDVSLFGELLCSFV